MKTTILTLMIATSCFHLMGQQPSFDTTKRTIYQMDLKYYQQENKYANNTLIASAVLLSCSYGAYYTGKNSLYKPPFIVISSLFAGAGIEMLREAISRKVKIAWAKRHYYQLNISVR